MVSLYSENMSSIVAPNSDDKRRSNLKRAAAAEILDAKSNMEESDEGENDIKPKKAKLANGGMQTPGDGNSTRSTPREGRVEQDYSICIWGKRK